MPPSRSPSYVLPDKDEFLARYKFSDQEFQETGLEWHDLQLIFNDYSRWYENENLPEIAEKIAVILRRCPTVHAATSRAKIPEKLVEKIIRRSIEEGSRWASPSNYVEKVPDLIGVRAIYLFNEQWVFVDNFIRINLPIKRSPKPIAYIQKPIPDRLRSAFTAAGLSVKIGKHGYQSVHYEMRKRVGVRSFRVEVQARTLYQEAWGEVSHVTAYPYRQDVALLVESMRQLAEITSKADHFSSAIEAIVQLWDARKARRMPDPAFVDDFIERLKFLKKHHPDIAADLIDASSEFSVSKLDSSFGLPTR